MRHAKSRVFGLITLILAVAILFTGVFAMQAAKEGTPLYEYTDAATLPGDEEITVEDTEPLSESVIPSESVLFVLIGTVGILGIAIAFLVPRIGKKT